jgi:hypothetical protein
MVLGVFPLLTWHDLKTRRLVSWFTSALCLVARNGNMNRGRCTNDLQIFSYYILPTAMPCIRYSSRQELLMQIWLLLFNCRGVCLPRAAYSMQLRSRKWVAFLTFIIWKKLCLIYLLLWFLHLPGNCMSVCGNHQCLIICIFFSFLLLIRGLWVHAAGDCCWNKS